MGQQKNAFGHKTLNLDAGIDGISNQTSSDISMMHDGATKWGDARSSSRALNHICGQSIDHYYKQFFLKGDSKRSLDIPYKASSFCFFLI